jgi:hypothetical protein
MLVDAETHWSDGHHSDPRITHVYCSTRVSGKVALTKSHDQQDCNWEHHWRCWIKPCEASPRMSSYWHYCLLESLGQEACESQAVPEGKESPGLFSCMHRCHWKAVTEQTSRFQNNPVEVAFPGGDYGAECIRHYTEGVRAMLTVSILSLYREKST